MDQRISRPLNWAILTLFGLLGIGIGTVFDYLVGADKFPPFLFPRVEALGEAFAQRPLDWLKAVLFTTVMSAAAAIVSATIGTIMGAGASYLQLWSLDRWAQLIWSIPLIAIAVYLLLVVGFGWLYGLSLAVFLGFYPIEKHVFDTCSRPTEGMISLAAGFGLSRFQEFKFLRVPASLRTLGTALAQALPLCFIGETMGEYTSAQISSFSIGLGGFLRFAQNNSEYSDLWVAILLMMFLVFISGHTASLLWERLVPQSELEAVR